MTTMGARDALTQTGPASLVDQWVEAVGRIYDAEGVPGIARRLARGLKREPAEVERELRDATYEHYAAALERTVRMLDGSTVTLTGKGGAAAGSDDSYLRTTAEAELQTFVRIGEVLVDVAPIRDRIVWESTPDGVTKALVERERTVASDWAIPRECDWWEPEPPPRPRGLAALGYGMASEVRS